MKDSANTANVVKLTLDPHRILINNTCIPQGLESLAIPYLANQPADSQLWDSNFCLISLFRIDKYLKGDAKIIICSLLKMTAFIRISFFYLLIWWR